MKNKASLIILACLLPACAIAAAGSDVEKAAILTPPPGPAPRINGPKVYGVRPGSPFLYRIPCTGDRPMEFKANDLPSGLNLDPQSGIITGKVANPGTHRVTLSARNDSGGHTREFRIKVGDTLALTPPMGWSNWNVHFNRIDDAKMREAADQMVSSGMADFGYQYVNIDDCWTKEQGDEPYFDSDGAMLPNSNFPDMKGLTDYIHGKGLKAGIYSSPGPWTCGGYVAAFEHEEASARRFAEWGFDFLKHDWCSYGQTDDAQHWPTKAQKRAYKLDDLQPPFLLMSELLKQQPRDIVFSLCQYGMGGVWEWGAETGNLWRTTGDLKVARAGEKRPFFYLLGMRNAAHWKHAGPGAWNDPDHVIIGWAGAWGDSPEAMAGVKAALTPDEQYSYMSMWSLMAAPLIYGGDMSRLDDFTLNVLCNSEVIDVNQDPLGKQAAILRKTGEEFVLVKPMEDGSKALGLFNLTTAPRTISVSFEQLEVGDKQRFRDLWRQKEIGSFDDRFEIEVPPHGVSFLLMRPETQLPEK